MHCGYAETSDFGNKMAALKVLHTQCKTSSISRSLDLPASKSSQTDDKENLYIVSLAKSNENRPAERS